MASGTFYCTSFYFTDIAGQDHQSDCVTLVGCDPQFEKQESKPAYHFFQIAASAY